MKAGYRIDNRRILKGDNCIVVYNYHHTNIICNVPIGFDIIHLWKDKNSIGIWKIKKLKQ